MMQKRNPNFILDCVNKSPEERVESERFFLRMHVNLYVPYFSNYDRMTIIAICKHLKKVTFDTDQLIMSRGDSATCMYIVISGEVGIYIDEQQSECVARVKENYIFGERALQHQAKRMAWVRAHKPTVCLTLDVVDFNKQIYFRENQGSIVRLKFMTEHAFCEGWHLDRIKEWNHLLSYTKFSA